MIRIGGFCLSIVRTCTGEVCVRRTWLRAVGLPGDIERVVHLPRGMIGGDVELGEIVVVEFDVRPFGDREPQIGEDRRHFVQHLAHRMDGALWLRTHGQGHVDAFGRETRVKKLGVERLLTLGYLFSELLLPIVVQRRFYCTLVGSHPAKRF